MKLAMVFADFNGTDQKGRVRLNCAGTTKDLITQKIELREGLELTLYYDDVNDNGEGDHLRIDGIVQYSIEEKGWVAAVDWNAIRHASDDADEVPSKNPAPSRQVGESV